MCVIIRRLLVLPILVLAGCTNYYAYAPQPAGMTLKTEPEQPAEQAYVMVTALGIQPPWHRHCTIDLSVRVENIGQTPLTFDPQAVVLLDAGLLPLAGPSGDRQPITIDPGQAALRLLKFELPEGQSPADANMAILNLRLTLSSPAGAVTPSVVFHRLDYYYYPGYYYAPGYYYHRPHPRYWR